MKKLILTIFTISVFFTGYVNAQNWESLNTGTGYILFDMTVPPNQSDVIYAAGMQYTWDAEGIIIKSEDGGDSWTQIYGGTGATGLEAICFTSVDTGYIAGWDGYFAKTVDGGETWTNMNAGISNWFFMDIEFFNSDNGIALSNLNSGGSGIYVTDDAGDNWTLIEGFEFSVQDVAYANAMTLYAVGSNEGISKSEDGGLSWNQIYSGTNDRFFMGVDFDDQFGVIGGEDGKILSTTNGGQNWDSYATGYHNFQGVHVFNADSAYIAGTDEDVYKTIDSGSNWDFEDNGSGQSHIYKVKFANDGTGFLCGSQGMMKRKAAPEIVLAANFEGDETDICDTESVTFTDLSTGNIISWNWTFEGGYPNTSNEQNPVVNYESSGVYDVSLTISDGTNENTFLIEDYITVHNCTGVETVGLDHLVVSPNPAKDYVRIGGVNISQAHVKIFDLTGRMIKEKKNNVNMLNISDISGGLYIMSVEIDGEYKQFEFVIE